jgi:hypothetical protein
MYEEAKFNYLKLTPANFLKKQEINWLLFY